LVFKAFVVHRETVDDLFGEASGGPLAELGAALAADEVADGEDDREVVVENLAGAF